MNANAQLQPLDGESEIPPLEPPKANNSAKRVVAVLILGVSVVAVLAFVVYRSVKARASTQAVAEEPSSAPAPAPPKVPFEQAVAAARRSPSPVDAPASAPSTQPVVPGIQAEGAAPIPLRSGTTPADTNQRAGQGPVVARGDESPFSGDFTSRGSGLLPESDVADPSAPAGNMAAQAQANLKRYQAQVGGMVAQLKSLTDKATAGGANAAFAGLPTPPTTSGDTASTSPAGSLFGSLDRSATPAASAKQTVNRSLVIPKGVLFACSLKTAVITSASGFVACQTQRHVWSEDGKVVLAERGSHLDGEYRVVQVKPGMVRIPVLWTRLRTPNGVTIELDSPATGSLGESGIGGYVDNRWPERIGAALLVSLINDAVRVASTDNSGDVSSGTSTVLLPSTTDTSTKLAERVLSATINIPPLIYQNQGEVVGVYVVRDLDFSSVYALVPR